MHVTSASKYLVNNALFLEFFLSFYLPYENSKLFSLVLSQTWQKVQINFKQAIQEVKYYVSMKTKRVKEMVLF